MTLGEGEVTGGGLATANHFDSPASLSMSGTTLAIGAESANCEGGLVKLWSWNGTAWAETQEIDDPLAGQIEEDCFGASVALVDDTLFVGQPGNGSFEGAATVYTLSGGTWTQSGMLAGPAQNPGFFGFSIAYHGGDAIVGAPWSIASSTNYAGTVYVYDKKAQWSTVATITPPLATQWAEFGASVALSGATLAVGAPGDFRSLYANNTGLGAVYSYTGSGSSWTYQAGVQPSDGAKTDGYGFSIDVNATGTANGTILVVGSPFHQPSGLPAGAGAAYVYRWASTSWVLQGELTASDAVASGNFGYTVAALSDTTILVGAKGSSEVYEFTVNTSNGTWSQSTIYTACTQSIGWNMAYEAPYFATGKGNAIVFDTSIANTGCVGP